MIFIAKNKDKGYNENPRRGNYEFNLTHPNNQFLNIYLLGSVINLQQLLAGKCEKLENFTSQKYGLLDIYTDKT